MGGEPTAISLNKLVVSGGMGGARKKIARCITAIRMFKWEVCMLFGQYLDVK
jgi:hypothetical protein